MFGQSEPNAQDARTLRKAKAADYAASLTAQIAAKGIEEKENSDNVPSMSESEYQAQEQATKRSAQLEYRSLLDAQVAAKNVPTGSPVRKLLKQRRSAEDDVEVVPTSLKDRPW